MNDTIQIRLPFWSAVVIAVVASTGVTFLATSLLKANRINELLRENARLRNELADKTEQLHRIEIGIVDVYRVALLDLMKRVGLDGGARGEGSLFLTMIKAVDAIESGGMGGGEDDLSEMQRDTNAEDLDRH